MIVGDVLQFVVSGLYGGETWQTVHHYLVDAMTAPPDQGEFNGLVAEWALRYTDEVYTPAAAMFSNGMSWNMVKGENLFNDTELGSYTFSPPLVGVDDGEPKETFVAYGWTTPSQRRGMNSGQRRMPGVTEINASSYGTLVSNAPSLGTVVAAFFSETLVLPYGPGSEEEIQIIPIIVKRFREGSGTPQDPWTYRLPRNTAERSYYHANGWTIKPYTTTQNSRKRGRGI